MGLRLADYCVTEAGFGADLGAEKFFDIKCRSAGLKPDCVVLVATVRALKYHGGQALERVGEQDLEALRKGMANLKKHLENLGLFGVPCVVAINPFASDSEAELALLKEEASAYGVPVVVSDVFARGGEGGLELGAEVVRICDNGAGTSAPEETDGGFRYLYDLGLSLREKVEIIATQIYGAEGVDYVYDARTAMERFERIGYGILPICMAKTQYSFTDDPAKRGRPQGFRLTVREVRLSAGARMIVPVCGKMTTMPGLPARPAAERIDLLDHGIVGLF
jgi:formate--tetrahydrofolate ligase